MDDSAPRKTRERSDGAAQPQNRAHAAEAFIRAAADNIHPPGAIDASIAAGDVIGVCAWCPELHILHLERTPEDQFILMLNENGQLIQAYRKRGNLRIVILTISAGICPECAARLKQ